MVKGVAPGATEEDVTKVFGSAGEILKIRIRATETSIKYATAAAAQNAISLSGTIFEGSTRPLNIKLSHAERTSAVDAREATLVEAVSLNPRVELDALLALRVTQLQHPLLEGALAEWMSRTCSLPPLRAWSARFSRAAVQSTPSS